MSREQAELRREAVDPAKVPRVARASAVIALLVALTLVWQALGLLQRDLAFTTTETEVSFWGRGDYQPYEHTREATGRAVEQLVAAAPGQPDYLTLAASYYAWRAWWADDAELEAQYTQLGQQAREIARQSRPAYVYNEAGETE